MDIVLIDDKDNDITDIEMPDGLHRAMFSCNYAEDWNSLHFRSQIYDYYKTTWGALEKDEY